MTIPILTLLVGVLATGTALAQDSAGPQVFDPRNYPPEVQAIRYANEECKRQDGGEVSFAVDTVLKLDLTGDGRDDYIVNFRDTVCTGFEAAYCGTGGFTMEIMVTLPDGSIRTVFSGRVRSYETLQGSARKGGPRTIRFALHGGYCGGHGNPSCMKQHRITTKPFAFRMPE